MQITHKKSFEEGEKLVKAFAETKQAALKQKIISIYAPLIKYIIGRINISFSVTLNKEDLYQYGILGLLKALERFDVSRGVPFKAYAYKRINGEVIDALRKEGLIGRDKYEKVKKLENSVRELTSIFGREPSVEEVCDRLEITEDAYYSTLNASQLTYTTSLNTKISSAADSVFAQDLCERLYLLH